MKADELKKKLVDWTAANSGYELRRGYLGMSQISKCPRRVYFEQLDGKPDELAAKLRCYRGYLVEGDLRGRIERALYGLGEVVPGNQVDEIAALDGRFLGHVDGEIQMDGEQVLLEIKSTTDERLAEIVDRQRIPEAHWMQVQCYLHFGSRWDRAFVVYEAVGSGEIYVHEVQRDEGVGRRCEDKARRVLEALDKGEPPRCRCGHCQK